MRIERKFIDWKGTGYRLYELRTENIPLRRFVCSALYYDTEKCNSKKNQDCTSCDVVRMDRHISRPELAEVFGVTEAAIANWESARSHISIENLLLYCQIAQVKLEDILVFLK